MKSVHEGQKFPCPQCRYRATFKSSLRKHIKSKHLKGKSPELKTEFLSDNDDVDMEEYFETDDKSEVKVEIDVEELK